LRFELKVLFVNRGEADARQDIRQQIKARSSDVTQSDDVIDSIQGSNSDFTQSDQGSSWRQLFIFPEGTTTNGKALIKFKTGAFQVGKTIFQLV
jgi:1-acyl-sn-glycerol-3-phosphate acyltransferase